MRGCPACGRDFRIGSKVLLFGENGKRKNAVVCEKCAGRGMIVVAVQKAPVVQQKTVRSDGVERALRQLRTLAKVSELESGRSDIGSDAKCFSAGRSEAFEGAIEVLKRECGQ